MPELWTQRIVRESNALQRELEEKRKAGQLLNEKETATYFARISGLFLDAAQRMRTKKHYLAIAVPMHYAIDSLAKAIKPSETELNAFMGGGHGIANTILTHDIMSRFAQRKEINFFKRHNAKISLREERKHGFTVSVVKKLFLYNAIHWGGVAELVDPKASPSFRQGQYKVGTTSLRINENGKIEATPELVTMLAAHTPHELYREWRGQTPIKTTGKAEIGAGEMFTLLRAASNSLHSLKMNEIFHGFRTALEKPKALRRTINSLTEKKSGLQYRGLKTSTKRKILADLTRRDFSAFKSPHYMVLAEASGLPVLGTPDVINSFRPTAEDWREGIKNANPKSELHIELKPGMAVVRDTGLGVFYLPLSQRRFQGRTSGFLQQRAANIELDLGKERRAGNVTAVLRFKKTG